MTKRVTLQYEVDILDKYEYKLKLEEIETLAGEKNYAAAAEIADSINWRKVRNVNSLMLVGEVYQQTGRYEDSKELLLMAYDRSPIGKKIIYRLAEMIGKQNDLTVVSIKDYIKHPKVSGYKSFHMHVTIPIFLSDRVVDTKVEIQIRTIAMDFWASLEHKIYYKFEGNAPDYISRDLRACAEIVSDLDAKMLQLNEAILEEKAKQEEKENNK